MGAKPLVPHEGIQGKPDTHDPYAILGLERGCTVAEVKKAFRKVMQGVHQDKVGTPIFAQMVNEARQQILADIENG